MAYLLDTHIWLWLTENPSRIPAGYLKTFSNFGTRLYFSSISCWEIVAKFQKDRLPLAGTPNQLFKYWIDDYKAQPLAFTWEHAAALQSVPMLHKDPFDRALVAQAQAEHLTLLTADESLADYSACIAPGRIIEI